MAATGMTPGTYGLIVWRLWLAGVAVNYGAWSAVVAAYGPSASTG